MNRKIKSLISIGFISVFMIGCSDSETESVTNEMQSESVVEKVDSKTSYIEQIDTTKFETAREVFKYFFGNVEQVATGEQLYDFGEVGFDVVLEKAENAQRLMNTTDHGNDKVGVVEYLITLDDLPYHISDEAFVEMGVYLVKEFKNGNLFLGEDEGKKLYIANLLVKVCEIEGDNTGMAGMFFDMFQGLKDIVRIKSGTFDEVTNSQLEYSMNVNIDQIIKYLNGMNK